MANLITLSVIKADVGGYVGHSSVHPALLDGAREHTKPSAQAHLEVVINLLNRGVPLPVSEPCPS